jgi:hypothetical protein
MSAVSKDQSIILQVAGKIAADLTPKTEDINTNVSNWIMAFDAVSEGLFTSMGMTAGSPEQVQQTVMDAFGATVVNTPTSMPTQSFSQPTGGTVTVKGKQHGPLPEWLITECAKVGVNEVWDNRDGLAANPKRPWFKATVGDKAFWQPRGK